MKPEEHIGLLRGTIDVLITTLEVTSKYVPSKHQLRVAQLVEEAKRCYIDSILISTGKTEEVLLEEILSCTEKALKKAAAR